MAVAQLTAQLASSAFWHRIRLHSRTNRWAVQRFAGDVIRALTLVCIEVVGVRVGSMSPVRSALLTRPVADPVSAVSRIDVPSSSTNGACNWGIV
jgi:hypothetical protein